MSVAQVIKSANGRSVIYSYIYVNFANICHRELPDCSSQTPECVELSSAFKVLQRFFKVSDSLTARADKSDPWSGHIQCHVKALWQ